MTWLALILLGGCSKQEPCDSNEFICDTAAFAAKQKLKKLPEPDPTDGTWIEVLKRPGCNGDPDRFSAGATVRGSTNGKSRLDIWQTEITGGFNESHPLVDPDPGNSSEELFVEMKDEATTFQYEPGARTTYICGVSDVRAELTYAIRVYDESDDLADCAVFTTEANAAAAIDALFKGDLPERNEVHEQGELTVENCKVWTLPIAG